MGKTLAKSEETPGEKMEEEKESKGEPKEKGEEKGSGEKNSKGKRNIRTRDKDDSSSSFSDDEVEITKDVIIENLEELRRRIILPIVIFLVSFLTTLPFSKRLLFLFIKPFKDITSEFIFTKPFEAFWVHIKVAAYVGLFISIPFFIWQIWLFVSPALYPNERKLVRLIIIGVTALFSVGTAFGYFFVLPVSIKFLVRTFSSDIIHPFLSISEFFSFAVKFSLSFGLAFQTPMVMVLVEKLGLVERDTFKKARPYAIVGAFVLAAVITPTPDALTQTLLAIPLIILWEFGIILTKII